MCGILAVLGVTAKGGAESVLPAVLDRARRLRHRGSVVVLSSFFEPLIASPLSTSNLQRAHLHRSTV
jgi:hypothetical protein